MPTNGFLPFATGAGANVLVDAAYAVCPEIAQGVQDGVADPQAANKTWRQGSVVASVFGQFTTDFAQVDTNDSQSIGTLEANFRIALAASLDGARMGVDTSTTANAITFPLVPLPTTLAGNKVIWFKPAVTNTGPATAQILKADGTAAFAALPVKKKNGADPAAGDLQAGIWFGAICDGSAFRLIGAAASDSTSSTSTDVPATLNTPFGTKLVTNTTRRVLTGQGAAAQQIAWDAFSFTKQRSDTNLVIEGKFYAYTPGSNNGAAYLCFNITNSSTGTVTPIKHEAVNGVGGNAALNIFKLRTPVLPAGAYTISVGMEREDTASWTTIVLPNGSDVAGTLTPSTGEIEVREVKSAA